jgi:hypothetical protein
MQNKANLQDSQPNVSYVKTKSYDKKTMEDESTKQTQSNPIYGERVEPTKPIDGQLLGINYLHTESAVGGDGNLKWFARV